MSDKLSLKLLLRSPIKTMLTTLLLAIVTFFFIYNLSTYFTQQKTAKLVEANTSGVLTAEHALPKLLAVPTYSFFLLTDPTNPGANYGQITNENFHHQAFSKEDLDQLVALPYVDHVDLRYMTAGISDEYLRLNDYDLYYGYQDRAVLEGTVVSSVIDEGMIKIYGLDEGSEQSYSDSHYTAEGVRDIYLDDVKLLTGNEDWLNLHLNTYHGKVKILICSIRDEYVGVMGNHLQTTSNGGAIVSCADYDFTLNELLSIEPGRRYVFVLRESPTHTNSDVQLYLRYCMGDDSRKGWWPYVTDITDLAENYLETDPFADLRTLIEVSEADRRTFDVVYTDNMDSIRRVSHEQIAAKQGRLISPEDEGNAVCVVSERFLNENGLYLGDEICLKLGNILMEQYAPLGAVAVTKGRYATKWTEQSFTIVGTWQDVSDGNWLDRELYWAYSNNTIFVPSSFLPESCDIKNHLFRPGEISFIVGKAKNIVPFEEEVLPVIKNLGYKYEFADRNWASIAEKMHQAEISSFVRLLVFFAAAIMTIVLIVYLFLVRRKNEYAILRALGNPRRMAAKALYLPLLLLSIIPVFLGTVLAWLRVALSKHKLLDAPLDAEMIPHMSVPGYLLAALSLICLISLLSVFYLYILGKKSPLSLLQEKDR